MPVAAGRSGACLVDTNGRPVWPLTDVGDEVAVRRIAGVFGAALCPVPDARQVSDARTCHSPDETVVALGRNVVQAARVHAHLTGRGLRHADTLAALVAGSRPAVVVTAPEGLTAELLDWLYDGGDTIPGIICADPGSPILRQVLVRAAAAALSGSAPAILREVFPTLPLAHGHDGTAEIAGGMADPASRRQMLTAGFGVLTVMTHSDGVDAFLGPGLTSCAMDKAHPGPSAAPRCVLTGCCHRHDRPVREVLASPTIIPPDAFAAGVLVWDVCFGVMPAGSIVDPRWGIGRRLADSAGIGALVTNWQITLSSPGSASRLGREIAAGTSVGTALRQANHGLPRADRSHRMCLFGDPRVRFAPGQLPGNTAAVPTTASCVPAPEPALSLLQSAMRIAATADDRHAAIARRALEATDPGTDLAAMRTAVLEYGLSRGKLLESWLLLVQALSPLPNRRCPVCHRRADHIEAILPPHPARRLLFCAICGIMEDMPVGLEAGIALVDRTLALSASLPPGPVSAGILVAAAHPADTIALAWPRTADGDLAGQAMLPRQLPPGPLRLSVFLVWDGSFAVVSRMMRDSGSG